MPKNALEGLASKKLNLAMLVERRARAQERRVVPETIARFLAEAATHVPLEMKPVPALLHAFDPAKTPAALRRCEMEPDWKLPALVERYPRLSTDRATADKHSLEWVTPGHPLFEALRRHALAQARDAFAAGACFFSLQHDAPARLDFYRARVVDGMGHAAHERLFAVELTAGGEPRLREPVLNDDYRPASAPTDLPAVALLPEATGWLLDHALLPFLAEVRAERGTEVARVAAHVELSLNELLQRADDEIGRAQVEVEQNVAGAEGRRKQAQDRHAELTNRLARRRQELERQQSLGLQAVERLASALILPHPERDAPDVRRLRPDPETEATSMRVVIAHEIALGRHVNDVHTLNLGYDLISLDLVTGQLRLIEVKGIAAASGTVFLTPNERRMAQDRPDCYWLYVVTNCATMPTLLEPIKDPARLPWHEVRKVEHYTLSFGADRKLAGPEKPSS